MGASSRGTTSASPETGSGLMSNQHCSQTGNGSDPVRPTCLFSAGRLRSGIHRLSAPPRTGRGFSWAENTRPRHSISALYGMHCIPQTGSKSSAKITVPVLKISKRRKSLALKGLRVLYFHCFEDGKGKTGNLSCFSCAFLRCEGCALLR